MRIDCKSCKATLDVPNPRDAQTTIVICPVCGSRHWVSKSIERCSVSYLGSLSPVRKDKSEPKSQRAWLSLIRLENRLEPRIAN